MKFSAFLATVLMMTTAQAIAAEGYPTIEVSTGGEFTNRATRVLFEVDYQGIQGENNTRYFVVESQLGLTQGTGFLPSVAGGPNGIGLSIGGPFDGSGVSFLDLTLVPYERTELEALKGKILPLNYHRDLELSLGQKVSIKAIGVELDMLEGFQAASNRPKSGDQSYDGLPFYLNIAVNALGASIFTVNHLPGGSLVPGYADAGLELGQVVYGPQGSTVFRITWASAKGDWNDQLNTAEFYSGLAMRIQDKLDIAFKSGRRSLTLTQTGTTLDYNFVRLDLEARY